MIAGFGIAIGACNSRSTWSRGLRDDLEATRHCVEVKLVAVECLKGVATREAFGEFDMTENIAAHRDRCQKA